MTSLGRRTFTLAALALMACMASFGLAATPARALDFDHFEGSFSTGGSYTPPGDLAVGGQFVRQAGAHPDFITSIGFDKVGARTAVVDLPPGLLFDPTAAPTCSLSGLTAGYEGKGSICPVGSQVGVITIETPDGAKDFNAAIYNMERPDGTPGLLGANIYAGAVVKFQPTVRGLDYGITATVDSITRVIGVAGAEVEIWGVPADPIHDLERSAENSELGGIGFEPIPSSAPRLPFVTVPTSCPGTPLTFGATADSWYSPGAFVHASFSSDREGIPLTMENCGRLRFEPSVSMTPDSRLAGAPTGLSVDIKVPQNESPTGLATAQVRNTVVTLPQGFRISPAAAQGQQGCSLSQIGLGSSDPDSCPPGSSIGSVRISSPLLEEELEGRVILASQKDNPFGSLFALYLEVEGEGVRLKLPGRVDLDPSTGQITATFANTPQLPFDELSLSLRGGPGAPLISPEACGSYAAAVKMTSWASDEPVALQAPIQVSEGCSNGGFSPKLQAGTVSSRGGAFSPFVLRVTGEDREANLSRIGATLPEGLLAKLAGVQLCPDAAASSGACPAASQVGKVTAGVGAGPTPLFLPEAGKAPTAVYLAGPYKGAPYSLVVKVPAQAGPFDLGTVAVRTALQVDSTTTQVTAESDPLPQILEGVPIAYRDLRVEVDRAGFTVNPTNCEGQSVKSTLVSASNQVASPSVPFAATDCEALGFSPRLALRLAGRTKRSANPALTAVLKAPAGQANLARAEVVLPRSEFIDQSHVSNPCTRVQFGEGKCPAKSVLGTAVAYSPLLDRPLSGPVYFRSNGGERRLPDIVADLDGQIHVTLVGFIDSVKAGKGSSRVRARFQSIPDAPVSRFVLRLKGGKRGLIENSADLCRAKQPGTVRLEGQNGKVLSSKDPVAVKCRGRRAKPKHRGA